MSKIKCVRCGKIKEVSEFRKNKKTKNGCHSWCKECESKHQKDWRKANPGYTAKKNKQFRKDNPDYHREWSEANPDYLKRWNEAHPGYFTEQGRKWAEANPEAYTKKNRYWSKIWIERHPDYNISYYYKRKYRAFRVMGGKCDYDSCGVVDYDILEIHHREGNKGKESPYQTITQILLGNTAPYQLLCKNHHTLENIRSGTCKRNPSKRVLLAMICLGGKCKVCGEGDPLLLYIHHPNGNIYDDELPEIVRKILSGRIDEEWELLCGNCHIKADIRDGTHFTGKNYKKGPNKIRETSKLKAINKMDESN